MKCASRIIFSIIIVICPMIFAINGFGVETWQWWMLGVAMLISNILGVIEGGKE